MKCILLFMVLIISQSSREQLNKAYFDYFEYTGNDTFFNQVIHPENQYRNPIIAGFYPDPSICRKNDDYYLVNSSFSYFPGIPIWHSKDLVSWKQIGYVLDRPSQLKLDGLELSAGIYAPTIRYNATNNTFYVISTVVRGTYNFIVKTEDPLNGWSEPILLPQIKGIDPSLFFDDNGKNYIVNGGDPKVSQWKGHKAIWLTEYDTKTDKVIGEGKIIIDGGTDTSKHPLWLEGPHLYKVKGKYYLMAAEGGTSEEHSEVIFESEQVDGHYKPCKINPILTQRNLDTNRVNCIASTGHADLIETSKNNWYAVFLGTRPYKNNYYNTGRETFLLPVHWKKNTPIILKNGKPVPIIVTKNALNTSVARHTGNFFWRDDFDKSILNLEWNMLRTPRDSWYKFADGKLVINATDRSIYDKVNPAFLGRRQQHMTFSVKTALMFTPKANNELAGLVLFQNEKNNIVIGKTMIDGEIFLIVQNRVNGKNEIIAKTEIKESFLNAVIELYLTVDKDHCSIYFGFSQQPKFILIDYLSIKHLSTQLSGGFVGSYIGLYATSVFNTNSSPN